MTYWIQPSSTSVATLRSHQFDVGEKIVKFYVLSYTALNDNETQVITYKCNLIFSITCLIN